MSTTSLQRVSAVALGGLTRVVWLGSVGAPCLVVFGSIGYQTSRVWEAERTSWTEGAGRWGAWTFLYGLAAVGLVGIGVVLLGTMWHAHWAPIPIGLASIPLWFASRIARDNWDRLLRERDQERDYALNIAPGLPVVTYAGAAGTIAVLVLAAGTWWHTRERGDNSNRIDIGARFA